MVSQKDQEIIEILQTDSRMPVSEIARKVGMSENGVRYRLERLEEAGYINQYTVLLNPRRFGKRVTAVFHINAAPKRAKDVLATLLTMEELKVVYHTTGVYTAMAVGLFADIDELNSFIESKLARDDIIEYTVDVVTRKLKDSPFSL